MNILKRVIASIFKVGLVITIKKAILIRKQNKFSKYYYDRNYLFKAIKLGEEIIKMFPEDFYNYQKLARAYWKNKNHDKAVDTLRKGMKVKYNINLEEIINELENTIPGFFISSNYIFKGGHQNFGLIEHTLKDRKLLTKILTIKQSYGECFIKDFQEKNIIFESITPKIVNILKIKDLCFITMEKIEGENPKIFESNFFEKVYEMNSIITSVKHGDHILTLCNNEIRKQKIILNNEQLNLYELLNAFYFVNDIDVNKEIFTTINQYFRKNNYSIKSLDIINFLYHNILENRYYENINPETHFTLLHGDFFVDNMLINSQLGELKVIDWGGIRVGPRWVDLAGFLAKTKQPFNEIKQNFLEHERCNYDLVEKLFFIYTLIVIWAVILHKEEFEDSQECFCIPAIKYVKQLILQLENEEIYIRAASH
ncbi:phosphotransferase [Neobacillus sp. D3-1R]|uniref:phosphotransferase n=1 Tax=Neobacillus sp. D3-1R TaxID=3445778 RepID=UPI003FA03085